MQRNFGTREEQITLSKEVATSDEAFVKFLEVYSRSIRGVCKRFLGRYDVDDEVQECMLHLRRKLHLFSGRCSLSTWVYKVVKNHCLWMERKRRLKDDRTLPLDEILRKDSFGTLVTISTHLKRLHCEMSYDPTKKLERERDLEKVKQCVQVALSRLSQRAPRTSQVLYLRYWEEMEMWEIAKQLDMGLGTVKGYLNRHRVQLRKQLYTVARELGYDPTSIFSVATGRATIT